MIKSDNANFTSSQIGVAGMKHEDRIRLHHCILDSTYNPILAIDADGKILFCNQAMARTVRSDVENMLGKNVEEFFSASRLKMVLQSGKAETVQKTKIGGKVYMSNRTPILDEGRGGRGRCCTAGCF